MSSFIPGSEQIHVLPAVDAELCPRCLELGKHSICLRTWNGLNGEPGDYMRNVPIEGITPEDGRRLGWHFDCHTLLYWKCPACPHEYLTYKFHSVTRDGRDVSDNSSVFQPTSPTRSAQLSDQWHEADGSTRGPGGSSVCSTGQTVMPTKTRMEVRSQNAVVYRSPAHSGGTGTAESYDAHTWSHIKVNRKSQADDVSTTNENSQDQSTAKNYSRRDKVKNQIMRRIMACDSCRESKKRCDPTHPGPRRSHKEWKNLKLEETPNTFIRPEDASSQTSFTQQAYSDFDGMTTFP